jgi:hypothetical protein
MSLQPAFATPILTPEEREASTQGWRSHSRCFSSRVGCSAWTNNRTYVGGILPPSSKAKPDTVLHSVASEPYEEHPFARGCRKE